MDYVVYFKTFIQLQVEFLGLFYVVCWPYFDMSDLSVT
jgi:hypothetical protein